MDHSQIQAIAAGVILGGIFLWALKPVPLWMENNLRAPIVMCLRVVVIALICAYLLNAMTGVFALSIVSVKGLNIIIQVIIAIAIGVGFYFLLDNIWNWIVRLISGGFQRTVKAYKNFGSNNKLG